MWPAAVCDGLRFAGLPVFLTGGGDKPLGQLEASYPLY